ncbi:PREDICTED: cytochrome c oxidase copper chaperone [Dipodomys ordii]|uniref:Cytochrome c oxidase copper chaperone n=1 Tax=Dipodomys ordii TaxID=10020 RepID=A0A1S3FDV0_DIPOR|nr:PREDICTED: cytochrome c oxidase copper chaperone [Dipodomys ordii]
MPGLAAASPAPSATPEKKPLKPCCACPETKKARDAWSVRRRGGRPA